MFSIIDLFMSGIDVGYKGRKEAGLIKREAQEDRIREGHRYCPIADFLAEKGRLGQKTGVDRL